MPSAIASRFASYRANDPAAQFQKAWMEMGPQQAGAGSEYWKQLLSYDPQKAMEEYTRGASKQAGTELSRQLDILRGQSVGAGRLDTGYFDTQQGELVRSIWENLNQNISQQALGAASLKGSQLGQMGQYATGLRQDYLDLLTGELDRRAGIENSKRAASAANTQAIIGGAMSILPFLL